MSTLSKINAEISRRLSAIVISKNVPVPEIAKALDVDDKRMRRMLEGVNPLSAAQLVLCAQHLGVMTSVITGEMRYDAQPSIT